jgi:SAM-dependent methyltransferase
VQVDLESERAFHNQRFREEDNRSAQLKYYWAIEAGAERYWSWVKTLAPGADILEYGCATGERSNELSTIARSIDGIDISDVAISRANARFGSKAARFHVMDAMNTTFSDGQFDLIFGSGIIHHLDVERCVKELSRVLRPSGHAVFWEPLGLNPMINLYRWMTPNARTPDEHPLLPKDFAVMHKYFPHVDVEFFGLTSLLAMPFRTAAFGKSLRNTLAALDKGMLSIPGLRMFAWYSLLIMRK